MKHDYFNEIIDRLIVSGLKEYDAIALVTKMMEEEADGFIAARNYFEREEKTDHMLLN